MRRPRADWDPEKGSQLTVVRAWSVVAEVAEQKLLLARLPKRS